ncbi:MAG: small basic family protein [Clostridium sp.]
MIYIIIVIGILLGVFIGNIFPLIPYTYSIYLSLAILAAIDSIFGAIASMINKKFDFKIFVSGFFGNAILTMALVYLGFKLNLDIHLAAIFVFVTRMFNNLSIIRRHYIYIWYDKYDEMKKHYIKIQAKTQFDKTKVEEAKEKTENIKEFSYDN